MTWGDEMGLKAELSTHMFMHRIPWAFALASSPYG
jgi:hypothetical protein